MFTFSEYYVSIDRLLSVVLDMVGDNLVVPTTAYQAGKPEVLSGTWIATLGNIMCEAEIDTMTRSHMKLNLNV